MCGRYFIDDEMWREIRKICKQIDDAKLKVTVGRCASYRYGHGSDWNEECASGGNAVGIYK